MSSLLTASDRADAMTATMCNMTAGATASGGWPSDLTNASACSAFIWLLPSPGQASDQIERIACFEATHFIGDKMQGHSLDKRIESASQ